MRNRFGGTCYRCKTYCSAGEGHFERFKGGWRVQHATCAIEMRGTPDPERDQATEARRNRVAQGTGRAAQRARKRLREVTLEQFRPLGDE